MQKGRRRDAGAPSALRVVCLVGPVSGGPVSGGPVSGGLAERGGRGGVGAVAVGRGGREGGRGEVLAGLRRRGGRGRGRGRVLGCGCLTGGRSRELVVVLLRDPGVLLGDQSTLAVGV